MYVQTPPVAIYKVLGGGLAACPSNTMSISGYIFNTSGLTLATRPGCKKKSDSIERQVMPEEARQPKLRKHSLNTREWQQSLFALTAQSLGGAKVAVNRHLTGLRHALHKLPPRAHV